MKIAGFKKQSLIDFPGHISTVVFTQGCNFRCGFCHNPDLVLPRKFGPLYDQQQVFSYLKRFQHLLDAVCITGGEPTLQSGLPAFIRRIKELDLKVKLDSNGSRPEVLSALLKENLLDFIAMDIKHILRFDYYNLAVGNILNQQLFENILQSVRLIEDSGIEYTFRTTVIKGLHHPEHIRQLRKRFGNHYKIQPFNPEVVLDPDMKGEPFSETELQQFL